MNGRETWTEASIEPVPMKGGTGLLITVREVARARVGADATDAPRRVEEELRASERLHALVTATADVVHRMSPDWSQMWQLMTERAG